MNISRVHKLPSWHTLVVSFLLRETAIVVTGVVVVVVAVFLLLLTVLLTDALSLPPPLFFSLAFIIQSYGSVLSPLPGADEQGNLSRALGSVVGIACLRTEGRVGPQLTSHVFGLLKARTAQNLGEEDRWLASDEGVEWVIRTIDTVLDVVMAERKG